MSSGLVGGTKKIRNSARFTYFPPMEIVELLDEHVVEDVQVTRDDRLHAALHQAVRLAVLLSPVLKLGWHIDGTEEREEAARE